jgi:heme-degrading monooxygenase HmoA
MIARHWKGIAKPGRAADYVRHLKTETFQALARLPGFVRASILSRPVAAGTEFRIVTVWESLEAIRAFAGDTLDVAVVPEAVQEWMVGYDSHVAHYEIVETFEAR